jgi:hypothetical protein
LHCAVSSDGPILATKLFGPSPRDAESSEKQNRLPIAAPAEKIFALRLALNCFRTAFKPLISFNDRRARGISRRFCALIRATRWLRALGRHRGSPDARVPRLAGHPIALVKGASCASFELLRRCGLERSGNQIISTNCAITDEPCYRLFALSNYWLSPTQGLAVAAVGAVFATQERGASDRGDVPSGDVSGPTRARLDYT